MNTLQFSGQKKNNNYKKKTLKMLIYSICYTVF